MEFRILGPLEVHADGRPLDLGRAKHRSLLAALLLHANQVVSQDREKASRPNDIHGQITWRSTRAKVLAQRGELRAAEELAREAIAFAEKSDFRNTHAHPLADLAEVLELAGRRPEAAEALRDVIDLYGRKGNVLATATTRERLVELEEQ